MSLHFEGKITVLRAVSPQNAQLYSGRWLCARHGSYWRPPAGCLTVVNAEDQLGLSCKVGRASSLLFASMREPATYPFRHRTCKPCALQTDKITAGSHALGEGGVAPKTKLPRRQEHPGEMTLTMAQQ